jgi:beta-lactam-binding protein with PASTA domain
MSMICESCGTENPPGTRFCVNTDCQAYLTWPELDGETATKSAAPSSTGGRPPSSEVKPGAFPDPGVDTPLRSRPTPETGLPANALSYSAGKSARPVDPPAKKAAVEPALPQTAQGPRRYSFIRETKAPVAVQPIDETPPPQPPGQSAANGKQGLWFGLDQHALTVQPGGEVRVGAQVLNKGTVVEGVDLRVLGVPQEWVRIEPPRVNLDVGGQAVLSIQFAPPKAPTTPSGPAEVEVAAWSSSNPQVRCAERLRLEVGAYHDLEVDQAPKDLTVRRAGEFRIGLTNTGNYPIGVGPHPKAAAAAEGKVLLKFEPRSVAIPPGGKATMTVRARAARRVLSGPAVSHDLELHLLGGGVTKQVDVNMVQRSLFPAWTTRVAAVLLPILVATLGIGAWHAYQNRPQRVPSVVSQPVDLAEANLGKAGFKAVPTNVAKVGVNAGVVFQQNPKGGVRRHKGAIINITVSSGPPTVTLDDLTQLTQRQAEATLTQEGLKARVVTAPNSSVPAGGVISQTPTSGTVVQVGSTVKITVSTGTQAVSVPSIKNLPESDAIALLGQVNLRYARGGTVPNSQLAGQVVTQDPAAGALVAPGSTVTATIGVASTAGATSNQSPPRS